MILILDRKTKREELASDRNHEKKENEYEVTLNMVLYFEFLCVSDSWYASMQNLGGNLGGMRTMMSSVAQGLFSLDMVCYC